MIFLTRKNELFTQEQISKMPVFNDFNSEAKFGTLYFKKISNSILGFTNLNSHSSNKTK